MIVEVQSFEVVTTFPVSHALEISWKELSQALNLKQTPAIDLLGLLEDTVYLLLYQVLLL